MKASGLMIGDIVYEGSHHKIKIAANYGRSVRYKDGRYTHEVEETYLNPVPLTEEILEANNNFWFGNDIIVTSLDINGVAYCGKLKYVHELQHALRLCGLNELADNFRLG